MDHNPAEWLTDEFLSRMQPHLVPELSDTHSQMYATGKMAVWAVRDLRRIDIAVRSGTEPPELKGAAWGDGQ